MQVDVSCAHACIHTRHCRISLVKRLLSKHGCSHVLSCTYKSLWLYDVALFSNMRQLIQRHVQSLKHTCYTAHHSILESALGSLFDLCCYLAMPLHEACHVKLKEWQQAKSLLLFDSVSFLLACEPSLGCYWYSDSFSAIGCNTRIATIFAVGEVRIPAGAGLSAKQVPVGVHPKTVDVPAFYESKVPIKFCSSKLCLLEADDVCKQFGSQCDATGPCSATLRYLRAVSLEASLDLQRPVSSQHASRLCSK